MVKSNETRNIDAVPSCGKNVWGGYDHLTVLANFISLGVRVLTI